MFSKKNGSKNLISNLAAPNSHKAHYTSTWNENGAKLTGRTSLWEMCITPTHVFEI